MTISRRIEAQILFDGAVSGLFALKRFEIDANRYESCNTAVLEFARTARTDALAWYEQDLPVAPWVTVRLRDLLDADSGWQVIFEGSADHVRVFAERGIVVMECRDALASLIDLRVQEAWLNHTGADLLEVLAQAAGLETSIAFPDDLPDHMRGQFWQVEHKRSALLAQHRFQTAGDLAFSIARDALCDLYVSGKTLVCAPVLSAESLGAVVTDVRGDVFETEVAREIGLLSGVAVHMASWDSRQRSATNIYYDGTDYTQEAPDSGMRLYSFRAPGRRLDDVKRLALGKYMRIMAHGLSARVSLPGIIGLGPRQFLHVETGAWDGILGVDQVLSRYSLEEGFLQEVILRDRGGIA